MTNSSVSKKWWFGIMAALFGIVITGAGYTPVAQAASKGNPFPKLKGKWKCVRGGCWVKPIGGDRERVGCRVRYKLGAGGKTITQSINCRGSIKLTAKAKVTLKRNNRVSGSWTSYNNHTGRVSGGASGVTTASKLSVGISSSKGFRGAMRATLNGSRHLVTLYQVRNGKRHMVGRLSLKR